VLEKFIGAKAISPLGAHFLLLCFASINFKFKNLRMKKFIDKD
jgi:hypothetical protein